MWIFVYQFSSVQLLSSVQLFATPWTAVCLASPSITNSESTQTHVHWVGDAIQPSHLLSSPSPPALNLSQHQSLFLKFKFIYFNWRLITLQYWIGFAIRQHESATGIHVFHTLNSPSLLPPHPIPLGHPSAPALSTLSPASNLDWWSENSRSYSFAREIYI